MGELYAATSIMLQWGGVSSLGGVMNRERNVSRPLASNSCQLNELIITDTN